MKKLLTLLLHRSPDSSLVGSDWWILRETTHHDPPIERVGMYTWPQIMAAIKHKLERLKNEVDS